ncbi:MAG: NAD(+) diphosphatase [Oscillospiraceae bacterium]|nr:NAD(+) diphosphatase [Oscillospiraceae bacterium]
MIQDISPSRLDNSYRHCTPEPQDILLYFDADGRLLSKLCNGTLLFTNAPEAAGAVYLFSIDDKRYFLSETMPDFLPEGFAFRTLRELRDNTTGSELYAAFTGYHLWKWYSDNRFCGKCGELLTHDTEERALCCRQCGTKRYPRINPAVIVGVTRGDCLLITRYRKGYAHNALVAGFTEIGETLEETVMREVMEETGIRVKNIRYYKSQPWGMAQDMLVGFFCDAEGDGTIRMDTGELKYAEWVRREEIVLQPNHLSLTNEMMQVFRDKRI